MTKTMTKTRTNSRTKTMTKIMTKTKTSFLLFLTKIKTKKDSDSLDSDSSLMELDAADLHLV